MDRIVLGVDTIRIRMTHPMLTHAFHDSPVLSPNLRGVLQRMVGRIVNGTPLARTLCFRMHPHHLPCCVFPSFFHDHQLYANANAMPQNMIANSSPTHASCRC